MKLEIIDRIQNQNIDIVRFVIDGMTVELANAFRRMVLSEVPSMAITEVMFVENDSVLFDEYIAHRLGLIPLTTDLKNYMMPNECTCGGQSCTLCQAQFTIDVKTDDKETIVYSRDMQCSDPKIHPVNPDIPIAKLGKKSALVLEAYSQLGVGKNHAKYQPVSTIGYKFCPIVTIDNSKFKDDAERIYTKEKCPVKVLDVKDGKLELIQDYWKKCTACQSCVRYSPKDAVNVDSNKTKFIFTVEATGALPLKYVLEKAVEIFQSILTEFDEKITTMKVNNLIGVKRKE